jgi:1-acyl-sn-glycerol-3-phosphate acyltransferase
MTAAGRPREERLRRQFQPGFWSTLQAHRIRLWLALVGKAVCRLKIEVEGLEYVPSGEPLLVAAAPHHSWIDPLLLLSVLPATPRLYFLARADSQRGLRWKRWAVSIAGGMAPVSSGGQFNREGIETALAILAAGNRAGIFPEGWVEGAADVQPLKRGAAFLSQHSGRRILPVGLSGTGDLWRGATLRVRVAPPLPALPPHASRELEGVFLADLHAALQAAVPPPPLPYRGHKAWRWLNQLL